MSAGGQQLALKSADGSAWAWGLATLFRLGDGVGVSNRSSPASVIGAHSFTALSAGNAFSLALKSNDGSAWGWGFNGNTTGMLGDNTLVDRSSPVSVVGAHSFTAISAGNLHSMALKGSDGSAWAWGQNSAGSAGDNTITNRSSPVSVVGAHSFNAIAAGNTHSLAFKSSDGSAWGWGSNTNGGLGNNTTANTSSPVSVVGAHSFNAIAAGNTHSLALKSSDGSAWAWGSNSTGAMGDNTGTNRSSPVSVLGAHSFNSIAVGNGFCLAIKNNDGSAWAWGDAGSGQLGNNQPGDNQLAIRFSPVSVVGGHSFSAIAAHNGMSVALKSDGSAWAWGARGSGNMGNNESDLIASPISVIGSHSFSTIGPGSIHCIALKSGDGSAWSWGTGATGELGDNSLNNRSSPISVIGAHSFTAISTENSVSLALKGSDGSAWAWGNNASGRLGDNTVTNRSSPVSVVGAHSFTAISQGTSFSLALKGSDGSVWGWSIGTNGRLGDNTTTNRSSPVSVVGAHSFTAISAANGHSVALKGSDGSAWCWGQGTQGQLGDNTATAKSSPVSVVGAHSFSAISLSPGNAFILALKADGSAWAWGSNTNGAFGDNTVTNRSSPVSVVGAHSFNSLSAGNTFSIALKSNDGSAWAWGLNSGAQLGDNTLVNKSSPVSVVGAHSFIQVRAANADSYGLKADGSVWCWGIRTNGALGNNTAALVASPVQVVQPTTAIKNIMGLAFAKSVYNNVTTNTVTITSVKTVNNTGITSIKSINSNQ